jgi:hypothetical protein
MKNVTLNWELVLKAEDFDSHLNFLTQNKGIYLWILPNIDLRKNRVIYVGETSKNFAERHIEHFRNFLSGTYAIFDIDDNEDFKDFLQNYYHDKTFDDFLSEGKIIWPNLGFLDGGSFNYTFFNENHRKIQYDFVTKLNFAFARVDNQHKEQITNKQIEAALIERLRDFYISDITGKKLKLKSNGRRRAIRDVPIGAISKYPTCSFEIQHNGKSEVLQIIPGELRKIVRYNCN